MATRRPYGDMLWYDPTLAGEIFVGQGMAVRVEAPNGLDRLTYDIDDNRYDGFSDDDFLRSQRRLGRRAELWAVPASAGEFPVGAAPGHRRRSARLSADAAGPLRRRRRAG